MIVLGIILLLLELYVFTTGWLLWVALLLIAAGVVLIVLGALQRPVGGRRHWF